MIHNNVPSEPTNKKANRTRQYNMSRISETYATWQQIAFTKFLELKGSMHMYQYLESSKRPTSPPISNYSVIFGRSITL